jgi:hypothetical protein
MSIFAHADVVGMGLQWDNDALPKGGPDVAMRLMAEGVPLRLLVDIALPLTLVRDLFSDTERAATS